MVLKLLAIFAVIGVGWAAGRTRLLGPDAANVLGAVAFNVFTPALLFRTTAAISVAELPWPTLAAYYVPTVLLMVLGYGWQRSRRAPAPLPSVRGLSLTFSNAVQLGVPVVTALFGAAGLAIHIGLVTLQALVLLTLGTVFAEAGLAKAGMTSPAGRPSTAQVIGRTARRSVIHPVVLPILLGLAYHATGLAIPGPVDDVLLILGSAVVPVSLVTIGLTLQVYGVAGAVRSAVLYSLGKLLLHPAVVLAVAYLGFGLRGLPLVIAVMCAALPIGANVLLFAARYDVAQGEVSAAIVATTTAFLVSGSLWLLVLGRLTTY